MLPYMPKRDFTGVFQVTDLEMDRLSGWALKKGRRVREILGQRKCRKDVA